jgi:hypothetical protein
MSFLSGVITLVFAVLISGVAAYFSVSGLAAMFSATYWPVVIMGGVLEGGKLVVAGWLHANWSNRAVGWVLKIYLLAAIFALMIVTAIGIYGYLSKGHLDQEAPLGATTLQIERRALQIAQLRSEAELLIARQRQLDAGVDALIAQNQVTRSAALRQQQRVERETILRDMDIKQREMARLNDELLPLRLSTTEVEAKLGPVRFVAELFGWRDTGSAVRLMILIMMFAFDPLAVSLILASSISFATWAEKRRADRLKRVTAASTVPSFTPAPAPTSAFVTVPVPSQHPAPTLSPVPVLAPAPVPAPVPAPELAPAPVPAPAPEQHPALTMMMPNSDAVTVVPDIPDLLATPSSSDPVEPPSSIHSTKQPEKTEVSVPDNENQEWLPRLKNNNGNDSADLDVVLRAK